MSLQIKITSTILFVIAFSASLTSQSDFKKFIEAKKGYKQLVYKKDKSAIDYLDECHRLARKMKNDSCIIVNYGNYSIFFHVQQNFEKALMYSDSALALQAIDKFDFQRFAILANKAGMLRELGDYEGAKMIYEKIVSDKNIVDSLQFTVLINYSLLFSSLKDYEQAIHQLDRADSLLLNNKDLERKRFYVEWNRGIIYGNINNFKKSIFKCKRAIDLISSDQQRLVLPNIYGIMSIGYRNLGRFEDSKLYADSALILNNGRNKGIEASNLLSKSKYFFFTGDLDSANYFNRQALISLKKKKNSFHYWGVVSNQLRINHKKGIFNETPKFIKSIEKNYPNLSNENKIYLKKYDLEYRLSKNNSKKVMNDVITFFEEVVESSESLLNEKLNEQELKYEAEKFEQQFILAESQQKLQNAIIKQQRTALIGGILSLLFLSVLAYFYYLRGQERKRNNLLLEEKNTILLSQNENIKVLNKEINHRVKNNLHMISSIVEMQSRRMEDGDAKNILDSTDRKIQTMSSLYKRLYSEEQDKIKIDEYLQEIVENLKSFFKSDEEVGINLNVETREEFGAEKALWIGLILNEVVTNAKKHAFDEIANPEVNISFIEKDENLTLEIADNGRGVIQGEANTKKGFGSVLIKSLVLQLKGKMTVDGANGMKYQFVFPAV